MKTIIAAVVGALILLVVLAACALVYAKSTGLSARPAPGAVETRAARSVRRLAVPADIRGRTNPETKTAEMLDQMRAHYAKQCAICHANDGSGDTAIGRGLYPKTPDMRAAATQQLSDGELFYIIEYGVRFTGMPAWGDGSPIGEKIGWQLVHFIRQLPNLTADEISEMEQLNPKSP
jgi:mono/diheme cytochrome c family protein